MVLINKFISHHITSYHIISYHTFIYKEYVECNYLFTSCLNSPLDELSRLFKPSRLSNKILASFLFGIASRIGSTRFRIVKMTYFDRGTNQPGNQFSSVIEKHTLPTGSPTSTTTTPDNLNPIKQVVDLYIVTY
jgi:hypothetical protein